MNKLECAECGIVGGHNAGCDTANGAYLIAYDGVIHDYCYVSVSLYDLLAELFATRGTLKGVSVYHNGKRLTVKQLGKLFNDDLEAILS